MNASLLARDRSALRSRPSSSSSSNIVSGPVGACAARGPAARDKDRDDEDLALPAADDRGCSLLVPLPLFFFIIVVVALSAASCDGSNVDPPGEGEEGEGEVIVEVPDCDAGDAGFVSAATLAVLGRRPVTPAELQAGVDAVAASSRADFVASLTEEPEFAPRWSELLLDDLYVPRTGAQAMGACWGQDLRGNDGSGDDASLAEFVKAHRADEGDFGEAFTFRDVLQSAIAADDVSVPYRAHLYALLTRLNGCNNVDPVDQELAFRDEVGHSFEAAYLNRDPVCLACHTTAFAVTDSDDPALDRHWPLTGRFEDSVFGEVVDDARVPRAVFRVDGFIKGGGFGDVPAIDGDAAVCGTADGGVVTAFCFDGAPSCAGGTGSFCLSPLDAPSCAVGSDGSSRAVCDNTPYCADPAFQNFSAPTCDGDVVTCGNADDFFACGNFDVVPVCEAGVVVCPALPAQPQASEGFFRPWGADEACGEFKDGVDDDDPAGIDARFASVEGERATVLGLDDALRRGVDALAANGLVVDPDGAIADKDSAFAYLVAMNIVDNTWREIVGTPLTIATHFPRNQAQRDLLQSLTDRFVASHFSLRSLVIDIVTSGYVNLKAPDQGCGVADTSGFDYPPVFDPWVRDEPDAVKRNNSAADAVHALSSRTLLSAAYAALGWPHPQNEPFPEGLGVALDVSCFDDFDSCDALASACSEGSCCAELDAACGAVDDGAGEAEFQRGIGVFHGASEKGFRGLDFQARLFFESRFGRCQKPAGVDRDVVDDVIAELGASGGTVGDAVSALEFRITGADVFDDADLGLDSDRAVGVDDEADLRVVCGALLASPQFQLTGIALE